MAAPFNPMSYVSQMGGVGNLFGSPSTPAPPAVGSSKWLSSAPTSSVVEWLNSLAPDYTGIDTTIDTQDLMRQATSYADEAFKPIQDAYGLTQSKLNEQRKLSTDAATNFSVAMTKILTGGLTGEAGAKYAEKTWGGYYLGEISAFEGQQMLNEIVHDFNMADISLSDKLAQAMSAYPEVKEKILQDLITGEEARIKSEISLRDSDYEHRVKALSAIVNQRNEDDKMAIDKAKLKLDQDRLGFDRTKAKTAAELKRLELMTKVLEKAFKEKKPTEDLVQVGGGLYKVDLETWETTMLVAPTPSKTTRRITDNALGQTVEILPSGRMRVLPGDNPTKPVTPDKPDPDYYTDQAGRTVPKGYRYNKVGELVRIPTASTSPGADRNKIFADTRKAALSHARDLWKEGGAPGKSGGGSTLDQILRGDSGGKSSAGTRPTWAQAYNALMAGYGQTLLGQGFSETVVDRMIKRVLRAASAGRWRP